MSDQSDNRPRQKVLRRLSTFLAILAVSIVLFLAGNLASFGGLFEFANVLGLKNPQAQSAQDPQSEVTTKQLAARVDEAAVYLDAESLYRYNQEDLDKATEASIEALIAQSGDKHAVYYSPKEFEEYNRASEGEYLGIGIVLTTTDNKPTVLEVYEGSPAHSAGVMAGDIILSINGESRDFTTEEASELIRQSANGSVSIVWQRDLEEIETTLSIGTVSVPTVVSHLLNKDNTLCGYIYLRRFNDQSSIELREAITSLESQGAQALILDLRGNPGGYLTQAVAITSLFVKQGDVLQIETNSSKRFERVSGDTCTDMPLVVLINAHSASASELTAAALKDHNRAAIVGEKSYGKGTIQDIQTLSWGGAIKFTIAHYLSPLGTAIEGKGVTPDIEVAYTSEEVERTATDNITSQNYIYSSGKDTQLDVALEEAKARTKGNTS